MGRAPAGVLFFISTLDGVGKLHSQRVPQTFPRVCQGGHWSVNQQGPSPLVFDSESQVEEQSIHQGQFRCRWNRCRSRASRRYRCSTHRKSLRAVVERSANLVDCLGRDNGCSATPRKRGALPIRLGTTARPQTTNLIQERRIMVRKFEFVRPNAELNPRPRRSAGVTMLNG